MQTLRARSFMHFGAGVAVTVAAAWSLSSWQASASVGADESTFVSVSPARILDTRSDLGLPGPFVSAIPQDLRVTGNIATANGDAVVVPDGATGVVLNVTAVNPTADGFVTIRPADAPGQPTTSNLNFKAGDIIPNSVTVQVPTSGSDAGRIEITYDAFGNAGPTTEILIDVVGYTKNAGLASLQAQVNDLQAIVNAATAPNAVTIGPDRLGCRHLDPDRDRRRRNRPNRPGRRHIEQIAPGAVTVDLTGRHSVGLVEDRTRSIVDDRNVAPASRVLLTWQTAPAPQTSRFWWTAHRPEPKPRCWSADRVSAANDGWIATGRRPHRRAGRRAHQDLQRDGVDSSCAYADGQLHRARPVSRAGAGELIARSPKQ